MKTLGANGLKLIQDFEELSLEAYQDRGGVWTVGYGHTGADVTEGMTIEAPVAAILLRMDAQKAEQAINSLVAVNLTQNQFDALVSFVLNLGEGTFRRSTMLRLLNEKRWDQAADEFTRWNKVHGKVQTGLTRRRNAECFLFLTPDKQEPDPKETT